MSLGRLTLPSLKPHVTPEEWQARVDLAACYRLVAHYGMSDMMANHITLRVPGEENAFLTNPYGMMYEEMSASCLVKIDHDGQVLHQPDFGELTYGLNKPGFILHSAIHKARPEVACVIHTHTPAGMAVSSLACGLLPMNHTSMLDGTSRELRLGEHAVQVAAVKVH
jgi:ribulose-5-phosphate 4-epimerase/fuculose-1-phosphate aldolase